MIRIKTLPPDTDETAIRMILEECRNKTGNIDDTELQDGITAFIDSLEKKHAEVRELLSLSKDQLKETVAQRAQIKARKKIHDVYILDPFSVVIVMDDAFYKTKMRSGLSGHHIRDSIFFLPVKIMRIQTCPPANRKIPPKCRRRLFDMNMYTTSLMAQCMY